MRRFAAWFCAGMVATLAPSAFAGQTKPGPPKPATTARPRTTTNMTTDSALLHPATLTAKAPDTFTVKFTTTKGDFVVEVTRGWAPLGADRFYNLVKHRFYDNASFFRVLPGFVVQFGLSANPQISKVWQHANIKDDHVSQSNRPGYITFATGGPNTRTTQVFINLGNNSQLDSMGFAPFGQVTSGMDVVGQLYSGYGEGAPGGRGPDQGMVADQGKPYLDKNFPNLDSIKTATVVSPASAPATPAHKPAASGGAAKP
jgi:cyclophilin family peptidyl-prolyl cis-trans isomerase